jgi:hypothetical protein
MPRCPNTAQPGSRRQAKKAQRLDTGWQAVGCSAGQQEGWYAHNHQNPDLSKGWHSLRYDPRGIRGRNTCSRDHRDQDSGDCYSLPPYIHLRYTCQFERAKSSVGADCIRPQHYRGSALSMQPASESLLPNETGRIFSPSRSTTRGSSPHRGLGVLVKRCFCPKSPPALLTEVSPSRRFTEPSWARSHSSSVSSRFRLEPARLKAAS